VSGTGVKGANLIHSAVWARNSDALPPNTKYLGAPLSKQGYWWFIDAEGYCTEPEYINHDSQIMVCPDFVPDAVAYKLNPGIGGQIGLNMAPPAAGIGPTSGSFDTFRTGTNANDFGNSTVPPYYDYWFQWNKQIGIPWEDDLTESIQVDLNRLGYQIDYTLQYGDASTWLNLLIQALSSNEYLRRVSEPVLKTAHSGLTGTGTVTFPHSYGAFLTVTTDGDSVDAIFATNKIEKIGYYSWVYRGNVCGPLKQIRFKSQRISSPELEPIGLFYWLRDGVVLEVQPYLTQPPTPMSTDYHGIGTLQDLVNYNGTGFP
jgi:hypothetical protein